MRANEKSIDEAFGTTTRVLFSDLLKVALKFCIVDMDGSSEASSCRTATASFGFKCRHSLVYFSHTYESLVSLCLGAIQEGRVCLSIH
jgi:hypothetical protein